MSKLVRSAHQNILGPQLTYSKCLFYLTVQTPKIFSLVSQKIKKMGKYIPLRALNQNILGIFFFCLKNNLKRLVDYQYCCRIIFCPLINRLIISFQQMNTAGYVQCIPEPLLFFISALFFFFLFLSITVQYDIMLRYFWPYTHLTSTPNTWVFGV